VRGRAPILARWATAVVAALAAVPAIARSGLRTDLGVHLRFAQDLALTGTAAAPYALFQRLVIAVRAMVPFHLLDGIAPGLQDRQTIWEVSGLLVLGLATAITAALIHSRIAASGRGAPGLRRLGIASGLTIALLLIGPITVLTWSRHQMLIGYLAPNLYHNPSYLLSRPIAIGLLWFVVDRFEGRAGARAILVAAVLSFALLDAKPSFSVCLLPAVGLLALVELLRRRRLDLRFLVLGLVVPTVLGLGSQLWSSRGQGSVALAPLRTLRNLFEGRGLDLWMAGPMVLASIAFPLLVAILLRSELGRSRSLQLAWLTFLAGFGLVLTFAIEGRADHGDLVWGAEISLFVLMVESALAVARRWWGLALPTRVALGAVFGAQVACGAAFWFLEVSQPTQWW
jgi:hypothetical protein